jgi:hypothetical protein
MYLVGEGYRGRGRAAQRIGEGQGLVGECFRGRLTGAAD